MSSYRSLLLSRLESYHPRTTKEHAVGCQHSDKPISYGSTSLCGRGLPVAQNCPGREHTLVTHTFTVRSSLLRPVHSPDSPTACGRCVVRRDHTSNTRTRKRFLVEAGDRAWVFNSCAGPYGSWARVCVWEPSVQSTRGTISRRRYRSRFLPSGRTALF